MTEARKIRLALMSDLHNEFEAPPGPARPTAAWMELHESRTSIPGHPEVGPLLDSLLGEGIDLVVLAGDIDIGARSIEYAKRVSLFLGAKVICVAGNHEGYDGRDFDLLIPEMRAAARATNGWVTFLENETAAFGFDGRRLHVLGCTLWTDYEANGDSTGEISQAMRRAADCLNDHRRIFLRGRLLTPAIAREMNLESRSWLATEVERIRGEEGNDAEILIVTHHAPVLEASGPQHIGGRLTPAFVSDMTEEITAWQPMAWIFGHTHHSLNIQIGSTRVMSAQRGYVCIEPEAEGFTPKIIEI
ncbi:metallophosphoesterase [Azospirillum sp. HJ39]|uniref:metallophosphoesterase n=1 Tax=Azospirillum sp. HJ39 TaxID=3159496 RepID=UPI0035584BD8